MANPVGQDMNSLPPVGGFSLGDDASAANLLVIRFGHYGKTAKSPLSGLPEQGFSPDFYLGSQAANEGEGSCSADRALVTKPRGPER